MNICNQVIRFSFSRRYLDLLHNVQSIYSTLKILAGKESICESISITLLNKMNIPFSKSESEANNLFHHKKQQIRHLS